MTLKDKSILLIIGGGVAAYKSLDLIRRLKEKGAKVRAILTEGGSHFITPLSVASLTGEKVYSDLFSLTDESEMGHIRLSREADLIVIAPATANLIAKAAEGKADDLATTAILASNQRIMICPSMNTEMWQKAATQRNISQLEADGMLRVGPDSGDLACGEIGAGRLADIGHIVKRIEQFFHVGTLPLTGKKAVVTAGPTHEAIDPVRYLSNYSSGKQGYAIAAALSEQGADVTLVSGPTQLACPDMVKRISVTSAQDMHKAVMQSMPCDIAIMVAAVADWRPEKQESKKIKDNKNKITLTLTPNPDILANVGSAKNRPQLVIGFAAETHDLEKYAKEKLKKKNCDWIIANDVGTKTGVMGKDDTALVLISNKDTKDLGPMSKAHAAKVLAQHIVKEFQNR